MRDKPITYSADGSHPTPRQQLVRYYEWWRAALTLNGELATKLGLMEAQRNHARWKAGVRRRKMREMRAEIVELRKRLATPEVTAALVSLHVEQHRKLQLQEVAK